jgi:hypothetical protein
MTPLRITLSLLLLAATLLLPLAASCGRGDEGADGELRRPVYDLGKSDALLDAGEALRSGSQVWEELSQGEDLNPQVARILREEGSQRELFAEANRLLQEQRFHDLSALLDEAERQGRATPTLLQLRQLPQALQALSLFCARRPYQKSEDLSQSLIFLEPWKAELSRMAPKAFPPFWESQEALLEELRLQEFQAKCAAWIHSLDIALNALPGEGPAVNECLTELQALSQERTVPMMELLKAPLEEILADDASWSAEHELACTLRWTELSEAQKALLQARLSREEARTFSGRVLAARLSTAPVAFLELIAPWRQFLGEDATAFSPGFLKYYRQALAKEPPTVEFSGVAEAAEMLYGWLPGGSKP